MEMTESTPREIIERAVLTLAGRCDGARSKDGTGFNRYDAPIGHELSDKIAGGREINLVLALKVVSKYRRQLEAYNIALPAAELIRIEQDTKNAERKASQPTGVEVSRVDKTLRIRFPYDPAMVEVARGLPQRKWDGANKAWTCPATALDAVLAAFPDCRLAGGLADELTAKREADAEVERARIAQLVVDLRRYEAIRESASLYAHQDAGCRWLIEQRKAILADDMGIGKTRQALVAAKALGYTIIVVAPAGLRINWLREAEAVDTTIEIFSWAKVPERIEGDYTLIADEAHYAQNLKAQRTKRFIDLSKGARAVFALTGTPIKNGRPANLFPLLLATDHLLARDRRAYELRYCAAGATRWSRWDVTGTAHLDELHRKISDGVLRRMKDECLDLPAKVRVLKKAELSAEARATYDATLHELQASYRARRAKNEIKPGADALVELTQLMHAGSLAKVEAAVEMAEEVIEQGGQVVLFTRFLDSAGQIADALNAGRITGAEDAIQRQAAIDAFQAGQTKAIVCTLGAGNVGITLTAAQTVILVDRPWTPGDAVQAEDRLHRIGQTGSVLAVWLQANGADEAIDALLEQKHERIELVLAGKRKTLSGVKSISDVAAAVLGDDDESRSESKAAARFEEMAHGRD